MPKGGGCGSPIHRTPATTSTICCSRRALTRSARWSRPRPNGSPRHSREHSSLDGRTRARHTPGARLPRRDVAASSDARRRWRPRPAHQSLLEPAVRLQHAALALPLRRRAVLDRAGQRRPAGAAADDRGSPAACAGPAGELAQARPERRSGAGLPAAGAPEERPRHARSGAAGAGRHRHRAGVRQRRHADHHARLSPGDPAAVRAGARASRCRRSRSSRRRNRSRPRARCCSTTCSASSRSSARPSAPTRWRFCCCPSSGR